jgi:putative transposase
MRQENLRTKIARSIPETRKVSKDSSKISKKMGTDEEIKASNKNIREKGKAISNHSILEEVRERDIFVQKKTKKERQKEEHKILHPVQEKPETTELTTESEVKTEPKPRKKPRVLDYGQLQDDYGW